jgi:hypothetical protein
MTSPQKTARLAIALDEVKPPVRRRVEVQLAVRLDSQLHRIIQIVMGWENYHLYEFRVGRDVVYGISYRDRDFPGTSPLPAKKATLADILVQVRNRSFRYVYDIGDDWRHTVKLEAVVDAEPGATYPQLLSAQGRCPPEDLWEVRGAMPCTSKPWRIQSTNAMLHVSPRPMAGRMLADNQPRRTEDERAGADRGQIAGGRRQPPELIVFPSIEATMTVTSGVRKKNW